MAPTDPKDTPEQIGDLPRIGRPATRAFLAEGITSLDAVTERTEGELLALHGVGPKAIRILREALAESGRALQEPSR